MAKYSYEFKKRAVPTGDGSRRRKPSPVGMGESSKPWISTPKFITDSKKLAP